MQQVFDLIEYTNRSVFLTGRAGTGKTTFLQNFVKKTTKHFAIVAPTGIAAINAGGVTIHSMFGLPLTTFAPTSDFVDPNTGINIPHLLPHFKYRSEKLKLLRTLELLVIDEVSMLRCDVADMMDVALRTARRNNQPFGGVQLLLVGDLYQLPPVVKLESESILYRHYNAPFFFDAKAVQKINISTVTLNKVYRQTDEKFLELLNAIRDNDIENINFELLHNRYQPQFEAGDFYVYLVSHNYMADAINKQKLDELPGKGTKCKANIWGDFKTHLYPNDEDLILKEDAQVMFIRNDKTEAKRYFNGMLATVVDIHEDEIIVLPQNATDTLTVERETWENKKYFVDGDNKIAEDIVGSYEQFPFKLAWAVTIHKSQGLTFDKVIIDAGKSFTSGQVYVALSRCRTLEGIILKSKIPHHAIITDERIRRFQNGSDIGTDINSLIEKEKFSYAITKLINKLDVLSLLESAEDWVKAASGAKHLSNIETLEIAKEANAVISRVADVHIKFSVFISGKLKSFSATQKGWKEIEEKSKGAVNFFFKEINEKIFFAVKNCYAETKGTKGLKGYNDVLSGFIEQVAVYLTNLKKMKLLDNNLYTPEENDDIKTSINKKPSHITSFQLFEDGKSVNEIAELRGLTESTVLSHLAKMAAIGVLDIERLFSLEHIKLFEDRFRNNNFETLAQCKNALPDFFDYNELRLLLNHFKYHANKISK